MESAAARGRFREAAVATARGVVNAVAIRRGLVTIVAVQRVSLRFILGCLVMVAMGLSQLLGVSRGFWCECAPVPKLVSVAACVASLCHPHLDHHDRGCVEDSPSGTLEAHHHDHLPPADHDHEHREVRESLRTTAVATAIPVPAPVVHDLPPSLLLLSQWIEMKFAVVMLEARSGWVSDGSPPTPVLVARTMVMLV